MYSCVFIARPARSGAASVTVMSKASEPAPLPKETTEDPIARLGDVESRRESDHRRARVRIPDRVN